VWFESSLYRIGQRAEVILGNRGDLARCRLVILEINEAGNLTSTLKQLDGYVFGAYPHLNMHAIPYESGTFDVVIHSDTLEHIQNPVHALKECRRVLPCRSLLGAFPVTDQAFPKATMAIQTCP